ncbi:uncharacterized protein LOC119102185 [Pollicipes pollicipes]|uniref:uncharacterized protein LOC119102185 n=1 Tax=Pollicipes pollicipes TaxID=41117 RepID=UPI00188563C5|nr:uncharacterized protein LOC119102185 [Pollicipes pollicipes]
MTVLKEVDSGFSHSYDELCSELSKGVMQTSQLAEVLEQLHQHAWRAVRRAPRDAGALGAGLQLASAARAAAAPLLFSLVVLLATTQPHCASDAIKVLVHALQFVSEADPLKEEPLAGDLSEEERCVHRARRPVALRALDMLLQTLSQRMPYVKRPARQQAAYFSSLLLLSGQLPQARPQLLRLVYRRLLQLDVLCPRDSLAAAGDAPPDRPSRSTR